jgi:hypothetical protein
MVILAILIGVLLILGLGCVGWQVMRNTSGTPNAHNTTAGTTNTNNGQTQGGGQTGPTQGGSGPLVSTFCDDAKGRQWDVVQRILKRDGFQPKRVDVPGPKDVVVELTPCQAQRGSVVTVKVGNGQAPNPDNGGGQSSSPGAGSGSGGTGGGGPGGGGGGQGGLGCSLGVGGGPGGCTPTLKN